MRTLKERRRRSQGMKKSSERIKEEPSARGNSLSSTFL